MKRYMAPRVTLRDVAEAAGVSPATVSHALHGNGTVSEVTAARVRGVAADIGYRPHRIASNLRRQRTSTIGVIIPLLSNPFLSELVEAIYTECLARGYMVLCGTTNYRAETEAHYIDLFLSHPCDGIIVAGPPDKLEEIIRAGVPAVLVDCHMPNDFVRVPVVEVEDMHGMYSAVAHLQRLGHHTIGLVYGPLDQLRQEGYRRALADAGTAYDDALVADAGELHFENAARVCEEMLRARPDVTAVAATTDVLAFGVLQAARRIGPPRAGGPRRRRLRRHPARGRDEPAADDDPPAGERDRRARGRAAARADRFARHHARPPASCPQARAHRARVMRLRVSRA